MPRVVYVDSGAFIALLWRRDRAHRAVSSHLRALRVEGARLVTSEPVLAETATRLRYDAGLAPALAFGDFVEAASASALLIVRESDPELRRAAFAVLRRYSQLNLSYADAMGAVVARQAKAEAVFGLDADFVTLGFALEPGAF